MSSHTRARRVFTIAAATLFSLAFPLACLPIAQAAQHSVLVTGTLRDALAAAAPGAILILEPRIYAEGHLEITISGSADRPITLRGAGAARSTVAGRFTLKPGVSHWQFEDFTIDATGQTVDAIRVNSGNGNLTLQRLRLFGGSMYGIRLEDGVHDVRIDGCDISAFRNSGKDSHGIGLQVNTAITITNNTIHGNSGDGVQSHTNDTPSAANWASGIVVANNTIFANGENAIDVKSTHGMLIQANHMFSYTAATGGEGIAVQIQYDAQDIEIRGNVIHAAVMGIELTRGRKEGVDYPKAPSNVRIVGNLMRDLVYEAAFSNAGNGSGIVIRGSNTVIVSNNTVLRAPIAAMYMGAGSTGELAQGIVARNNIFHGARNDLNYNSDFDKLGGAVFSHNHFVSARVRDKALPQWISPLRDAHLSGGEAQLDAIGIPAANSPVIDSGLDIGHAFAGSAPDRGWSEFAGNAGQLTPVVTFTPAPSVTPDPTLIHKHFLPIARRGG
jgi:hypothetical protein